MHADSLRFSAAAQIVAAEARRLGLTVPGFRSPPGITGATRTIRRGPDGGVVSIAVRGRPQADVVADLIEGVVVANGLIGGAAVRCRRRLAGALDDEIRRAA
jgi:hypothetical protein